MTFKQQALAYLQDLPEDCTEEDLKRFLAVRQAVKKGEDAIRAGQFVSQEYVDEMLDRWLAE